MLCLTAIPHIVYAQQTKKPNILYIVADDLGWKDVGFHGSDIAKLQSKKGMIQKLLRHKDPRWTWKLMCNRWPEEFRDRVATEISGPNGVPLMPQNPSTSRSGWPTPRRSRPTSRLNSRTEAFHMSTTTHTVWRGNEKPANSKKMQLRNLRFPFRSNGLIMS